MTETGDEVPRSWGEEFVERAAEDTQPYELVLEIARKHLERGRAAMNQPTRPTWGTGAYRTVADWLETAEDNASEFLVYLRQAPQVAKAMKSSADLRRMYRKWVTEKRSPAGKELWQVISSALLALEKSGIVERAPEYRGYFNHNNVRWYLKGRGGRQARHLDPDQIANAIPLPSPKSAGRKILSPTEARTIIKNLLTLANGEITMQEIVKSITPHLLLFKTDYMDPVRSTPSKLWRRTSCPRMHEGPWPKKLNVGPVASGIKWQRCGAAEKSWWKACASSVAISCPPPYSEKKPTWKTSDRPARCRTY